MNTARRVSYVFLCLVPFLSFGAAAAHALRIPGVYHVLGGVLFAAISIAAWTLGAWTIRADGQGRRQLGLAGTLLVIPFALVALLWVGVGGPWQATAAENQMRYLVLIVMASAATGGFVVLREALREAGEHFYSTLGFAAIILAGPLYLIWNAVVFGAYFGKEHAGQVPPTIASLNVVLDLVLSLAAVLAYLATAAFAASLGRVEWIGRKATRAYIIVNVVAVFFLVIRYLQYSDPAAHSTPWYITPGFILAVPAIPLIMPALFGSVVLRRAGDEQTLTKEA